MEYTLPPKLHVRPHGKLFHVHHGVKMVVYATWIMQRQGGKVRRIRTGETCLVCGFSPNAAYKRAQLEAMEVILGG